MSDIKSINDILIEVMRSDKGIRNVMLVDNSGLTIANVNRLGGAKDTNNLGAIASAIFFASAEQGNGMDVGRLDTVTSEFETGKIFVHSCGRSILCIVSSNEVNIGLVRLMARKYSPSIDVELSKFLDVTVRDEDAGELTGVLDSLDKM